MDALFARLRRLAPVGDADGELLARHAAGDEAAFAELVRRHGPTVYAAARRRLPDPQDAADVFQATFLVLVRKSPRLAGRATVGPWLYRVAALTARNLRRKNARRLAHRRPLADVAIARPPADLDDALLTLSERDRAAVVLCHLYGHTRREAAARLGLPEGTLSAVLHRALRTLRTRLGGDPLPLLAAGGVAVPAGVVTAACQSAAVVRLASLAAAGPAVASLTRGALRMFWLNKLAAGGMAAVACLGIGLGVGLAPRPAAADPPKTERKRTAPDSTAGPRISVRVDAGVPQTGHAPGIVWSEYDGAGAGTGGWEAPVMAGNVRSPAALMRLLDLVRRDTEATPRRIELTIEPGVKPAFIRNVAQACADAGFPTVTYTGPLPESWTLGKNQDGKPARSWTGHKLVKGERVELAKVLPLDPPAPAHSPRYYVIVGRGDREDTLALPSTGGDTVLGALIHAGGLAGVRNVWVARPKPGGADEVLPVDVIGMAQQGDPRTNYQLLPGDRLHVKRDR